MFRSRRYEGDPAARSERSLAMARNGMACTSHSLASSAALAALRSGGNAIDAAITAAATLAVIEPYSTGIGGDCFMLIWSAAEKKLFGLNGSGRAGARATRAELLRRGVAAISPQSPLAITVPGAVDAWCQALERFGTRPLAAALEPAIALAEDGFPVTEVIGHEWGLAVRVGFLQNDEARRCYAPGGEPPRLGEIVRLPDLARTLRRLAAHGGRELYEGETADRLAAFLARNDALIERADLAAHRSTWVEPISTDYRGYRVCEMPPNTQGIAALLALNVLERFDVAGLGRGSLEATHLRIEAVKIAYADRARHVADPECARVPVEALLDKAYARERAAAIDPRRAIDALAPGALSPGSDTVYLTVADRAGNVVSLINSLFTAFGSGFVADETGIALQSRGSGFSLDPAHPNCIAPGKRPFHTIIPGMILEGGAPRVSFGVMGGHIQAQAHVQMVSGLIDFGLNVQEALDQPRFHYVEERRVALEPELERELGGGLSALGHQLASPLEALARGGFGGGQAIMVDPATGAYWGGSDRRKDGCAIGY